MSRSKNMSPRNKLRTSVKIVQIMQGFNIHTHHGRRTGDSSDSESETEPLCSSGNPSPEMMDHDMTKARSGSRHCLPRDIPHGYLGVYVGRERKRFVISTHYLNHRLFKALLKRSEEEFGFEYEGGLTIACEPVLFEHLLWLIATDDPAARTSDAELDDLLAFYEF